jgi:hypothetical protein
MTPSIIMGPGKELVADLWLSSSLSPAFQVGAGPFYLQLLAGESDTLIQTK